MLEFADPLRHRSHGTINAPGSWAEENHGDQPEYGGRHHNAEKAKGKLGHPRRDHVDRCPLPRQFDGPQQSDGLLQRRTRKYLIGAKQHQTEHRQEKG